MTHEDEYRDLMARLQALRLRERHARGQLRRTLGNLLRPREAEVRRWLVLNDQIAALEGRMRESAAGGIHP